MANKNPSIATRFKVGEVRNPLGAGAHDPVTRAIKRLTAAEVAEIGALVVSKNVTKLKAIVKDALGDKTTPPNPDSKHSTLKVWMATIALKAIAKGDAHSLDVLLNRLVGRVKERIELTGAEGGPVRSLVGAMTSEERQAELKRLRAMRKDAGGD